MPRRGGGRVSSPARSRTPNLPARHAPPPPPAVAAPQPRQPGLLGQMAATAGGVAIGSTVGHVVGHAITGGVGGRNQDATPAEQTQQGYAAPQQQYQNPCQQHMQAFLDCANKNSHDLSLCYGFNEALKDCKLSNGLQ